MNTYGKPAYKCNSFFHHLHEVRRETNHIYEIIDTYEGKVLFRIYKESKTIKEFKERMKNFLGW